jgi:hypothetical protein
MLRYVSRDLLAELLFLPQRDSNQDRWTTFHDPNWKQQSLSLEYTQNKTLRHTQEIMWFFPTWINQCNEFGLKCKHLGLSWEWLVYVMFIYSSGYIFGVVVLDLFWFTMCLYCCCLCMFTVTSVDNLYSRSYYVFSILNCKHVTTPV